MEKIGVLTRKAILNETGNKINNSNSCFFISFNKLPAFPLNVLRNNLRRAGGVMFLAKNSLLRKAFEAKGYEVKADFFDKETAVVFSSGKEVVDLCKILTDFSKENEALILKGGFLDSKAINVNDINSLAKLPSREVLIGKVVSGFASPLTGFVCTLNQVILKFVWTLEEIKKKKK